MSEYKSNEKLKKSRSNSKNTPPNTKLMSQNQKMTLAKQWSTRFFNKYNKLSDQDFLNWMDR